MPTILEFKKKGSKKAPVLEGGWNFSGRDWKPSTIAYNSLLNGLTENYRNNITPAGVGEDLKRNYNDAKGFLQNPNPEAFALDKIQGQASRYGGWMYRGVNSNNCGIGQGRKKKGGKLRADEVRNLLEASYQDEPPEKIGDWILDNGLSNQYGKVYYSPDGRAVVAHRGTSGALDWGNNLAYALGQYENTDRYKQGKAIQEQAESKYGAKNISTLGHSQGSVLSRKLGKNTKEIINVNPAYKGEVPLKNEYNIRSSKDVVSGLYAPVSKISKVLYPSYTDKHSITIPTDKSFDVLGNHSYDILNKLGDKNIGEGAGVVKPNYPDWEDLKWGSFTKQFQRYKQTHPHSSISNLEDFAKSILRNPNDYHPRTLKRARFYLNVILKKKGGNRELDDLMKAIRHTRAKIKRNQVGDDITLEKIKLQSLLQRVDEINEGIDVPNQTRPSTIVSREPIGRYYNDEEPTRPPQIQEEATEPHYLSGRGMCESSSESSSEDECEYPNCRY
jgi:hypothetical protein